MCLTEEDYPELLPLRPPRPSWWRRLVLRLADRRVELERLAANATEANIGWRKALDELKRDDARVRSLTEDRDEADRELLAVTAQVAELTTERDTWRTMAGRVTVALTDSLNRYDGLALRLADQLVELRRDGFHPRTAGERAIDAYLDGDLQPTAASSSAPPTADEERQWNRVVEAAQERAGGNKELYSQILGDAHRWRAMGLPLDEIRDRIYAGDGQ